MNKQLQPHRREHGQSLVEFSIGMVVLLVLLVSVTDTARVMFTYLSMRDASQEGALYASVNPTDTAAIESRVRNTSDLMSGLGGSITVAIEPTVTGKQCFGDTGGTSARGDCHGDLSELSADHANDRPVIIGSQNVGIHAAANNKIISPKCP